MSRAVAEELPRIAPPVLCDLIEEASRCPSPGSMVKNRFSCAIGALKSGDEETAKKLLAQAVAVSRHFNVSIEIPPKLQRLLKPSRPQ